MYGTFYIVQEIKLSTVLKYVPYFIPYKREECNIVKVRKKENPKSTCVHKLELEVLLVPSEKNTAKNESNEIFS